MVGACLVFCIFRDVRLIILERNRWSMIEKYRTILKGVSLEELNSFVDQSKSHLYVEGLVQGNVTSKVGGTINVVLKILHPPKTILF